MISTCSNSSRTVRGLGSEYTFTVPVQKFSPLITVMDESYLTTETLKDGQNEDPTA